ncbi:MAG: Fur family transcriptional regulator [Deltaproteobacteria bacterium]
MTTELSERLREKNLKVTPKRTAVIELFLSRRRCFGPQDVWRAVKPSFGRLGLPSVYRILEELRGAGVLERVEKRDRQLYYVLCTAPRPCHHHHFVCRKCGRVEEVDFCNIRELERFIERRLGCKAESHSLRVEGLCARCR